MKVNDIRSFFNKKQTSGTSRGSSSRDASEERVVKAPSRLTKRSSKKSKKEEDARLNDSIERSDDDSDREEPLPKKSRKQEDRHGKGTKSKSRKPVMDDDDSDKEDPLPKSSREKKEDKKRKARVLSESDDDDFKPSHQSQKKSSLEKPAAKQPKVEKPSKSKQKDLKPVNPEDFFSSTPIKREAKKGPSGDTEKKPTVPKTGTSPLKKEDKKSLTKTEQTLVKTPPNTKRSNENYHEIGSPQKPPTSLIEPKKLNMGAFTPERKTRSQSLKSASPSEKKKEDKPMKSLEKKGTTFKVPTPVNNDKSRSRTGTTTTKRSDKLSEEDDDEDDFNPKQKATTSRSSSASKSASSSKSGKSRDQTPPTRSEGTDDEEKGGTPKQTEAQKENFKKYLAKMSMKPKNLGAKDIPTGAPNCLQGLAFVISGVLDSLERDDCKDLIVKYGGRVTGSVSRKTNYLVVGDEPGESKVKKAVQLKVPQITEDEVLEMLRKSNPSGNSQDSGLAYSQDMNTDSEPRKTEDEDEYDADKSLFSTPVSSKTNRSSRTCSPKKLGRSPNKSADELSPSKRPRTEIVKNNNDKRKNSEIGKQQVKKQVEEQKVANVPSQSTLPPADAGLMWVDKYKPKTLKNVVGQVSESSNAKKLVKWLQNWFKYHGSSQDKAKASWPGLKDPEGKTFKAALLSGPPGVGKTTSAHLAVKEVGYDYFELNASDTRNKRGLHENVADALSSKSLVFSKGSEELSRKHVLIMDEVDGMSGNEDRGGVQELIALIKSSRVPVICICNDRNHQKIRSLANYCFDLRFYKPTFEQLRGFVSSICFKEKIKISQEKVRQLIIGTDSDVRQILHQLELFKEGESDQAYNVKKDLRFGPWDVIRKVFSREEHENMSIHDKNGLFFQDYNIGPLFVQENYLKFVPFKAGGNRYKHMDLLSKTAASLADGDMVESVIRRSQNWGLLPVQAVFASYMPGEYMESNQMANVNFPQWLGKNSNKSKRHRLLQGLHTHLQLQVSGSLEALNMDYLPYLRRTITKPLIAGDHMEAAKVMENYTLLREDVESINDLSLWPGSNNPMEKVETRVKTAFTKQVNKEILPYSNAKPVKGKGRGGGGSQEDELEALMEEGEANAAEDEEEDDSVEKDAMVKIRKRKAGTSKDASKSTGKGKSKKAKDDYDDDDDDFEDYVKTSKGSKGKQPAKPRKGK